MHSSSYRLIIPLEHYSEKFDFTSTSGIPHVPLCFLITHIALSALPLTPAG